MMKFAAVKIVVLAGIAQATMQSDLRSTQDMASMGGMGQLVEMMGAQQQPNIQAIIKQAICGTPCLLDAWDKLPCSGKSPLKTLCANTDKIRKTVTPCAKKCGFSDNVIGKCTS